MNQRRPLIHSGSLQADALAGQVPVESWDASYRVNLRGPVLLAQALLPGMAERGSGVFVCVSSVGEAYMGAYETFKAAQVHLGQTLAAELEESGVVAFTIGPGLVRTPGAEAGIAALAPLYGKSVEEFYAMSAEQIGDTFARHSGLNDWAAANRRVVLYPQAETSLPNPQGCWDWWGFAESAWQLDPLHDTREGTQTSALMAMIARLQAAPETP